MHAWKRFWNLCIALLAIGLVSPAYAEWVTDRQNKMGTRVEVQVWHVDPAEARRLIAMAMAEVDRIEAAMSTYIPSSQISSVNAGAAKSPVTVTPELYQIIERSLALSALTNGAFDISYDSAGQLYDYRAQKRPVKDALTLALETVDYRLIELDPENMTIRYRKPGVRMNLGGIAKGYAMESAIKLLEQAGVKHALAVAGGDTRILGDRQGEPWIVGVRDPDDEKGIVTRLALTDEAISTSGDYERFFVEGDVLYHHILTPQTGESVTGVRSATVVGPDAVMTDGLSTSVFVLGPQAGLELIESMPDYEAIIIDSEHRVRFSTGLSAR